MKRPYSVNPTIFTNPTSSSASYLLGLIYADGYIRYSAEKYKRIAKIIIQCVTEDMNTIKAVFADTGRWNFSIKKFKNNNWKENTKAEINNRPIVEFLVNCDFLSKSKNSPTKILEYIPNEKQRYFFQGLFDGDGCWSFGYGKKGKTRYFSITSTYDQDWISIIRLFDQLEIIYHIKKYVSKKGRWSCVYVNQKKSLNILHNYLYPNGFEFGFRRKYDKSIECMK